MPTFGNPAPIGPISVLETYAITTPLVFTMTAGAVYKVVLKGTVQSNVEVQPTFNLRMGAAGTLADPVVASISPFVNPYNISEPFEVEFTTTIQTGGTTTATSAVAHGNGNGGVIGVTETNQIAAATGTLLGASVIGVISAIDQATITTGSATISIAPSNGIYGLGYLTGGTLYTPAVGTATYNGVALTGGNGTGATANITVTNGSVTAVQLVNSGTGYFAGDMLSATAASIGGTGSGFSIPVAVLVNGPANIGLAAPNNTVAFATTVGNLIAGTVYYITSANISASGLVDTIQVSATQGGTPIVASASGVTHMTLAYNCVLNVSQGFCTRL